MSEFLKVTIQGPVAVVTLNRPETRNAISTKEDCEEFEAVCESLGANPSVSVVILTGSGVAFSSGGDLKKMRDRSGFAPGKTPIETRNSYRKAIQRIPLALHRLEIPTIAAVNGPAMGAGLDLACMCDMRVSSDRALYAESFVKVGIVPGDGGAWFLPRVVGLSKAMEMSFTGDSLTADQALACGLVSRVVPHDSLMDEALALAGRIAVNPVQALRLTKRLIREGQHMQLASLLELSAAFQAIAHETSDHAEAVASLLEKRAPQFNGH